MHLIWSSAVSSALRVGFYLVYGVDADGDRLFRPHHIRIDRTDFLLPFEIALHLDLKTSSHRNTLETIPTRSRHGDHLPSSVQGPRLADGIGTGGRVEGL
jgi:hypothetical protein